MIAVWFAVHHHFFQCLFCREQDINMHRIYGWWVFSLWMHNHVFFSFSNLWSRGLWDLSHVSLSSNHLHFCRSTKCLTAVSCMECLCAKSYRGVINPDLSAHVFNLECPHISCSESHVSHILQIVVFNSLNFIKVSLAVISCWSFWWRNWSSKWPNWGVYISACLCKSNFIHKLSTCSITQYDASCIREIWSWLRMQAHW